MPVRVRPPVPNNGAEASTVMQWIVNPPSKTCLVRSQDAPPIIGENCMSKQEEILNKAYGNMPKEVGYTFDLDFVPGWRGFKYYWYKLIRRVTR